MNAQTIPMPSILDVTIEYIVANFSEELSLEDLASNYGSSKFAFCRQFQAAAGISPMRWLWAFRTILSAEFIKLAPHCSLTDIAFTCGFTSSAHFSRQFKQAFQTSPSKFKRSLPNQKSTVTLDSFFTENQDLTFEIARKSFGGAISIKPAWAASL